MSGILRRQPVRVFAAACVLLALWLLLRHSIGDVVEAREQVNVELGLWGTRFLIAALAITPLSNELKEPRLRRWRRPLGLAAVGFSMLHTVQYAVYSMAWPHRLHMVVRSPYQVVGLVSLLLLAPLALTSSNAAVRRLGPRRWKALHRLVYPAAALAAIHALMGWGDPLKEPGLQALAIVVLLAMRLRPPLRRAAQRSETIVRPHTDFPADTTVG